jgi:integrase/recombinase XerD
MAQMSPLRRRMIEDMTIRNLSPATQQSYVHAVSKFSQYFGRSPDRLELRKYGDMNSIPFLAGWTVPFG